MAQKTTYVNWDTVPVIMDVPLAANLLGISSNYLKQLARKGKFPPAFKISPQAWRVEKDALMEWIGARGREGVKNEHTRNIERTRKS